MSKIINGEYARSYIPFEDIYDIVGWEVFNKIKSNLEECEDDENMVNPDDIMYNVLTKYFKVGKDVYEIMEMFKRIYSIY